MIANGSDRTTRIPSDVASLVTTNHAAKGSVFINLRNGGNLEKAPVNLIEQVNVLAGVSIHG